MDTPLTYNYHYAQCMVMKLGLAVPDKEHPGRSKVLLTLDEALRCIQQIDRITQGIQKIYYLVGWQYLGHDDKYPDFFEVNEALRRPEDKTALDSLRWFCQEAKQYHSVISVHINFNDAYDNAPSFPDFVKAGALIRKHNGKPDPIEKYNGRKCYKTCHKGYWESGLFKRQIDRFITTFPFIAETGTIHVDNFQCYKNYAPAVRIAEMQAARRKMIEYVKSKGIDITSEFTYKESDRLPNRPIFGLPRDHFRQAPMATVGLIPMSWWIYRMTDEELLHTPPALYCGGEYREKWMNRVFYGNMHGEDIVTRSNTHWTADFIRRFATYQVPGHYLNTLQRHAIRRRGGQKYCLFSDSVIAYAKNSKITKNGKVMKDGNDLCLPFVHQASTYIAYSQDGDRRDWPIFEAGKTTAHLYQISENGNIDAGTLPIQNHTLHLDIPKDTAYKILVE